MRVTYFDNNATTAVSPEVLAAMLPYFGDMYGNPSSMYTFGGQVAGAVENAREQCTCWGRILRKYFLPHPVRKVITPLSGPHCKANRIKSIL